MRGIIWGIFHLRRPSGPLTRIMLSKIDLNNAFRKIPAEWSSCPLFGYAFHELIVGELRLQCFWQNSPGVWCLVFATLEHS